MPWQEQPQVPQEQPLQRRELPEPPVLEQQELRPLEPLARAPPLALFRQVL